MSFNQEAVLEEKPNKAKKPSKASSMTVADYLNEQINLSSKTQLQIAEEAGFNKPNIITMIKQGKTPLPVRKVVPMAKALGLDPVHLFGMVMREYQPETWEVIETIVGQPVLTANELEIIGLIREANPNNPIIETDEERVELQRFAQGLKSSN